MKCCQGILDDTGSQGRLGTKLLILKAHLATAGRAAKAYLMDLLQAPEHDDAD
jgi:hypothetical protein